MPFWHLVRDIGRGVIYTPRLATILCSLARYLIKKLHRVYQISEQFFHLIYLEKWPTKYETSRSDVAMRHNFPATDVGFSSVCRNATLENDAVYVATSPTRKTYEKFASVFRVNWFQVNDQTRQRRGFKVSFLVQKKWRKLAQFRVSLFNSVVKILCVLGYVKVLNFCFKHIYRPNRFWNKTISKLLKLSQKTQSKYDWLIWNLPKLAVLIIDNGFLRVTYLLTVSA